MKTTARIAMLAAAAALAAAPGVNAEILLFAGPGGTVHQLDTATGALTFRGVCSGPVSSMAAHDGTLYLGDPAGSVYAFDLDTNLVTAAFNIGSDANAMAYLGGQMVIGGADRTITFVDAQTGAVDHALTNMSTDITAIGVDAGGLFVGGVSSIALRSHIGSDNFLFFAACGSQIQSMAFGTDTMYLGGTHFGDETTGVIYNFNKFEGGVNYTGTNSVPSNTTAIVYSGALLYIAGSDGVIHEMDPQTGVISRTFETGIDIQAMTPESGLISCPADYDASGQLNFLDVSRFIDLFVNQQIPADTNGDGQFNYFDISRFVTIYASGC